MVEPTDIPESTKTRYEVLGAHTLHRIGEMTTELTQDLEEDTFFIRFKRTPAASPVAPPESRVVIHNVTTQEAYARILELIQELRPAGYCGEPNPFAEKLSELDFYVRTCLTPLASPVAGGSARIAEIASRLAAATPGPWTVEKSDSANTGSVHYSVKTAYRPAAHDWSPRFITFMCGSLGDFHPSRSMNDYRSDPQIEADARFLAAAPDDIAYLLKLVPEGWVKVTPETMPAYDNESEWVYVSDGSYVGTAIMEDYHTNAAYFRTSGMTHFKLIPLPAPPAAEEERSSL